VNILLTSAGRRTSLVLAFQNAVRSYGGKVMAADPDPLAPACALADEAFCVPLVNRASYVDALLRLARGKGVGLIVPTIDTELPVLAEQGERFRAAGVLVAGSKPGFVALCRDKWETFRVFQAEGIEVPASWLPGPELPALPEQLFLKPRDGSASVNAYPCAREDLARLLPMVPNPIIQERLDGSEVTLDALLDFQGRPIHFVPRERIRTLGGESIQGVTLDVPELDAWAARVLEVCGRLGAQGPITLQAFLTGRGPVLTEINPRFGGGFPLALAAGGDYPAWLVALQRGETLQPRLGQYRRGLYMTRYYTEIFKETLPWPSTAARQQAVAEYSGSGPERRS
jgi:carbamoyl-phosphate synthase large subunit